MNGRNHVSTPHPGAIFRTLSSAERAQRSTAQWAQEFALQLRGFGATPSLAMLTDLGERFYPVYWCLDPSSVADAVWSKWPVGQT